MARHWFSAARNTEEQGSLTIATTVRVQSDSRFEQLLYEALAEIANMELRLDRSLSQAGLFPAIDVNRSWSRRDPGTDASGATSVTSLRTSLGSLAPQDAWQAVAERIRA
jgi:transcription termination factor Rho